MPKRDDLLIGHDELCIALYERRIDADSLGCWPLEDQMKEGLTLPDPCGALDKHAEKEGKEPPKKFDGERLCL